MARDILSIMATSVPVERMFSVASLILTSRRASLGDDVIEAFLSINLWMKSSLKSIICEIKVWN